MVLEKEITLLIVKMPYSLRKGCECGFMEKGYDQGFDSFECPIAYGQISTTMRLTHEIESFELMSNIDVMPSQRGECLMKVWGSQSRGVKKLGKRVDEKTGHSDHSGYYTEVEQPSF